jgi:hypothetical protein
MTLFGAYGEVANVIVRGFAFFSVAGRSFVTNESLTSQADGE